jgi:hypothetical protein
MSNWISKATNAFQGDESSSSQTFELWCDCGQKHAGVRRAKWQRIVCRACGGSLFVMQRDPYPPPKEKPEPRISQAAVEELKNESPETAPTSDEYEIPETRRRETPRPKSAVAERSQRTPPPIVAAPSLAPRKSNGGFWKPFRIIIAVIALLGAVTGLLMYQSSQRSAAERALKDSIDKIKDSLLNGEWIEARNQLTVAVHAVDRLGRDDDDALRFRQQLRETTALTSLLSQPLSDLLLEADKAEAAGEKDLATFQYKVQGQWLLIEGQAEPMLSDKKSARVQYRIPLPLTIGAGSLPVEVVIVSAELSRLLAKSESESVILAVQIQAIQLSEDQSTWQIQAEPESAVLWAYRQTYQGFGYTAEETESVATTLASQAKSLGVGDEPKTE